MLKVRRKRRLILPEFIDADSSRSTGIWIEYIGKTAGLIVPGGFLQRDGPSHRLFQAAVVFKVDRTGNNYHAHFMLSLCFLYAFFKLSSGPLNG